MTEKRYHAPNGRRYEGHDFVSVAGLEVELWFNWDEDYPSHSGFGSLACYCDGTPVYPFAEDVDLEWIQDNDVRELTQRLQKAGFADRVWDIEQVYRDSLYGPALSWDNY